MKLQIGIDLLWATAGFERFQRIETLVEHGVVEAGAAEIGSVLDFFHGESAGESLGAEGAAEMAFLIGEGDEFKCLLKREAG